MFLFSILFWILLKQMRFYVYLDTQTFVYCVFKKKKKGFFHCEVKYPPISSSDFPSCDSLLHLKFIVLCGMHLTFFFSQNSSQISQYLSSNQSSFPLWFVIPTYSHIFYLDFKEVEMIIISNLDFICRGKMNCCLFLDGTKEWRGVKSGGGS